MDTTSSSLVVNNRDAPPSAAEDDGALSVTSGLAKEAASLFQSGKFVDCVRVLHQLLLKKENDPKVLHNIAIAENFEDGCSNPKKVIEELTKAKKRSEDLASAASDHAEPGNNAGAKALTGINGNNDAPQQLSTQQISPLVYTDDFDPSVTMYNLAVCWFHLHEHAKAFSILEGLFQNIEPIDEEIAKRICLLLLDVALLIQNAARSADVISYLEKVFCSSSLLSQVDNGNCAQPTASTVVAKSASLPSNSTIADASHPDSPVSGITSDGSLSMTLSEEGLEDDALHLISSMEMGGPRQSGMKKSSNDQIRSQADESISTADMRIKLLLCKVRFLLLTRNLKAAKREVKMAMNTARAKDYSIALYLKSQLEYTRGNHRKAIKLLMASSNRTEMGISSIYYNNLGCIYYRLGKHHTSSVLFSKALTNSSSLRKEQPLKLSTISQDKSLLITYNCGIQYLACGKPLQAASCFYKASQVFYNRPLLWLRIAECCLIALDQGLLKSSGAAVTSDKSGVRVHVVGKGKWRQLVMENGISRNEQASFSGTEDLASSDTKTRLSVSLARQCLQNALHLLNTAESKEVKPPAQPQASGLEDGETRDAVLSKTASSKNGSTGDPPKASNVAVPGYVNTNGEVKEQKGGVTSSQNASLSTSVSEYETTCRKENLMIEQAVLADLAFVELELGNPLKALTVAKSLLKVQGCSRVYAFLGNVYAAEALCLLNRPKEAAEHLSTYISSDRGVDLPFSREDSEVWRQDITLDSEDTNANLSSFPSEESQAFSYLKPEEARGILFANLAAMSAVQGEIEQAQTFAVQALSTEPQHPEAILTAVYVDLLRGRVQEALSKLKHCSCIRFLPGSTTLNGSS